MIRTLFVILFLAHYTFISAQKNDVHLKNAVVIGQFDKIQDRFTIESMITRLFVDHKINAVPSLNYIKMGEDASLLSSDSLQQVFSQSGFDTYVIVSVRGYDRKYKPSTSQLSFKEKLEQGTLREIYINGSVSVTFEFAFYQNNTQKRIKHIRCTNVSDRDSVLKRLTKKMEKTLKKGWK